MFAQLAGQERLKRYFMKLLATGKMPHSFLFYGPEGVGKTMAALELARIITCFNEERRPCGVCASCVKFKTMSHPDVMLYFPVPGSMKPEAIQAVRGGIASNPYKRIFLQKNASLLIDMVREIKQRLRLQSYQGRGRVVILLGCESLTTDAGNALLKILEEPPPYVTIILTTTSLDAILPTIRSRCHLILLSYLSVETIAETLQQREGISAEEARYYATLSGGSYARALEYLQNDFKEMAQYCTDILLYCAEKPLLYTFELINVLTEKYNVNELKSILEFLIALLKYRIEMQVVSGTLPVENEYFKLPEQVTSANIQTVEHIIDEIENSVDLLTKNVYLTIVLLVLFLKLRKIIRNE